MVATDQIRTNLHRLIDEEDNPSKLAAVQAFLLGEKPSDDFWNDLSEADKASIERGVADADAGRVVSWEEIKKRFF
jgi:predicted transcriptional regulator